MMKMRQMAILLALIMAIPIFAWAEASEKAMGNMMCHEMGQGMKMQGGMMTGDDPGNTLCSMHGMMMGKEMVATSDGGVVVMLGNKLYKYDRDLNLKKEVEMKIDMESMKKMMMQKHENMPGSKTMQPQE